MRKSFFIVNSLLIVLFTFASCSSAKKTVSSTVATPVIDANTDNVTQSKSTSVIYFKPVNKTSDTADERLAVLKSDLQKVKAELERKRAAGVNRDADLAKAVKIQEEIAAIQAEKLTRENVNEELAKGNTLSFIATPKEKEKPKPKASKKPASPKKKSKAAAKSKKDNTPAPAPKSKSTTKETTASKPKTAPKPKADNKPAEPPKPVIKYETVTEKMLGNYFVEEDPSANEMYCLHSEATIGSKVRVKNPMNGKIVTLKCIGRVPSFAENSGVSIKITYSAVRKLNLRDERFQLVCTYERPVEMTLGR